MELLVCHLKGLSWNLILEDISKIYLTISSFIKIWPEWRLICIKINLRFCFYSAPVSSEKVVEKTKYPLYFLHLFFSYRKSCVLWYDLKNIVELGGPQITIWRMRHAWETPKSPNTLSRNMLYLMPFYYNSGNTNVYHSYVTRTLRVQLSKQIVRLALVSYWQRSPQLKWVWRSLQVWSDFAESALWPARKSGLQRW